jgi:hypothetical protein
MCIVSPALGLIAAAALSSPVLAYCPPEVDYSVRGEFRRADIVAIVRAKKVTWLDESRRPTELKSPLTFGNLPGGLDPYIGAYYEVTLEQAFKGRPSRRFRIFSENTTARTPLVMDKPLLLFITRETVGDEYHVAGDFTVDNCGNSARADTKPELVRTVRQLANHR